MNGATALPNGTALPAPSPAALGLIQDDEHHLNVPEQLKHLVQTRRQWVDTVGAIFDQKEQECPGRIYGLPQTSIYEGIDEEVQQELARLSAPQRTSQPTINGSGPPRTNGKGKGRAKAEDMAVDLG